MAATSDNRSEQMAKALEHVHKCVPPDTALQAVGINPVTVTAEEQEHLMAAEREANKELLSALRKAAETDPGAARWLRERGLWPREEES